MSDNPVDYVLLFLTMLLIGATIVGIVKRGRFRLCRMFLLFLVAVFVTDALAIFWERLWIGDVWLWREALHNVLRYAVAFELAYFAFRSFPGARSTARALLLLLLSTTLFSVVFAVWEFSKSIATNYDEIIGQIQLPQLIGVIWLLMGISIVILWYRLPVDRMHKAILLGWIPYLLIFSVGLERAAAWGWRTNIELVNYFTTGAYFLLLAYWTHAAWAPAGATARAPAPLTVPVSQVG
jgi:hypothetical protein